MLELNKVLLTGRLTKDPELRYLPSGQAVCEIRIAVSRRYLDKNSNEWKDDASFINVTTWGKTAEFTNQYFNKGKAIFIEGRLKQDTWQDKETGNNREKLTVVAERASFVESRGAEQGRGSSGGDDGEFRRGGGRQDSGPPPDHEPSVGASSETRDDLPF